MKQSYNMFAPVIERCVTSLKTAAYETSDYVADSKHAKFGVNRVSEYNLTEIAKLDKTTN